MATPDDNPLHGMPEAAATSLDVPTTARRNLRIGNLSGAVKDAQHAFAQMVHEADVDVISANWLSVSNVAGSAIAEADSPDLGYEASFYDQLTECIDDVAARDIKVVTNAGAMSALALSQKVEQLCTSRGHELVIATVIGDDISGRVESMGEGSSGLRFKHSNREEQLLGSWDPELKLTSAVAYLGGWGIATALKEGADIVICGSVTEASAVIGAAAWWYSWSIRSYRELAGALVAGRLTACASHSGHKHLPPQMADLTLRIAEIHSDGSFFVTKPEDTKAAVNKLGITTRLLRELQGELYVHPDVVADLSNLNIVETGEPDTVYISGAVGRPPSATTQVMIAAPGGFQAETAYYINGPDVSTKVQMIKKHLAYSFQDSKSSKISAALYGVATRNPPSQLAGTVVLRVLVQARQKEDLRVEKFRIPSNSLSFPGYDPDFSTLEPKPFMEIFAIIIAQSALEHTVLVRKLGKSIRIAPPTKTAEYPKFQPAHETAAAVDLTAFGQTVLEPLGSIVYASSGDRAGEIATVGFFVRYRDEYTWLSALLAVQQLKDLLGKDYQGREIERAEFPLLCAVNFRVLSSPGGNGTSLASVDGLGKGLGEYLRSKYVEIPIQFLRRGRI